MLPVGTVGFPIARSLITDFLGSSLGYSYSQPSATICKAPQWQREGTSLILLMVGNLDSQSYLESYSCYYQAFLAFIINLTDLSDPVQVKCVNTNTMSTRLFITKLHWLLYRQVGTQSPISFHPVTMSWSMRIVESGPFLSSSQHSHLAKGQSEFQRAQSTVWGPTRAFYIRCVYIFG